MARPPSDHILERLTALHPKIIDLSLGRVNRLLAALGHPERRLPPVIHVAGTNGKGSVVAFLRGMIEASGRRAHVYTSPHLVRFHERIRIAGALIDEDRLASLLTECETANAGAPITFFEITTAAAFLAFARTPADVTLLEVGLGGRLDATNVIDAPSVTVITPVDLDHQQFLGDTVAKIAAEKAGILKQGVPAVIAAEPAAAEAVIAARAKALHVPLYRFGHDFRATTRPDGFRYESPAHRLDLPPPALLGPHQIENAAVAIAALEQFDRSAFDSGIVARGLAGTRWPGRLHRLRQGPLPAQLAPGAELWLDGGHNPSAGRALARVLDGWAGRPIHLIVGQLSTKDTAGFLAPLAPLVTGLVAVTVPGSHDARTADEIAAIAGGLGFNAASAATVADALKRIAAQTADMAVPGRVLICGSLYLAGHVLAEND
ncbi:MAG: folylpolyglutamate synthase/dihydrofolate synthase family protein [Alphaproteobacteria bacterium]